ncbi:MAG: outer membrane beta-barrel protein [Sulfurovaceae bacterium]|nr:outer membrane beta-barrel protein [Sulfurovaceae bacterium]
MNKNNFFLLPLVVSTFVMASDVNDIKTPVTNSNGFYIGANIGVVNFGGSGETTVTNNNRNRTREYNGDINDMPINIKLGYITKSENRLELYYQSDQLKVENYDILESSIFGFNYQWGLSSLSSSSLLPFIRLGIGFGSTTMDRGEEDSDIAAELNTAIGVYYKVFNSLDLSMAIYRKSLASMVLDDYDDDKSSTTALVTNGVEIGFNYRF